MKAIMFNPLPFTLALVLITQQSYAFARKAPKESVPAPSPSPSPSLSLAMPCSQLQGNELAGQQCETFVGAVFTKVQGPGGFGLAWKDPSGEIWSTDQGSYSNQALTLDKETGSLTPPPKDRDGIVNTGNYISITIDTPATRACTKIGGHLPSYLEYRNLVEYLTDRPGPWGVATIRNQKDIKALFPTMSWRYWTSTVDSPSASYFTNILSDEADGYFFEYGDASGSDMAFGVDTGGDEYGYRGYVTNVRCVTE